MYYPYSVLFVGKYTVQTDYNRQVLDLSRKYSNVLMKLYGFGLQLSQLAFNCAKCKVNSGKIRTVCGIC